MLKEGQPMTEAWKGIQLTDEAKKLLRVINLSCPMTEKDPEVIDLYGRESLNLGELSQELPITTATLYSALRTPETEVDPSVVIRAFGGQHHLGQTEERLKSGVVKIRGKIELFKKFMAEKSVHLDSEENRAALTLIDTLIAAKVVGLSETTEGRTRADLQFLETTIKNAAIPRHLQGQIKAGEEVLTHYGTVIAPITPWIQETVKEIGEEQKKNPIFKKALGGLKNKTMDCSNFCPSETEKGMDLATYSEEQQ